MEHPYSCIWTVCRCICHMYMHIYIYIYIHSSVSNYLYRNIYGYMYIQLYTYDTYTRLIDPRFVKSNSERRLPWRRCYAQPWGGWRRRAWLANPPDALAKENKQCLSGKPPVDGNHPYPTSLWLLNRTIEHGPIIVDLQYLLTMVVVHGKLLVYRG